MMRAKASTVKRRKPAEIARAREQIARALLADESKQYKTSRKAMHELWKLGYDVVYPELSVMIRSRNESIRALATRLLGQIRCDRKYKKEVCIRLIVERLKCDKSTLVITDAAFALGFRFAGDRATPNLLELAKHPDEGVRLGVAHALGHEPNAKNITALLQLTADKDKDVRNWATFYVACFSPYALLRRNSVRSALRARLHDRSIDVRAEAMEGLSRLKDPEAYKVMLEMRSKGWHGLAHDKAAANFARGTSARDSQKT